MAVPSAIEVTRPVDDTVATAASDVAHVTAALGIVSPFASVANASTSKEKPSEANVSIECDNTRFAVTCPQMWYHFLC